MAKVLKKYFRSISLIIHDFSCIIFDIWNKLPIEVFSAKFSEKRNKIADACQQNNESSEEADESQKTPVFVKRFQEAETVITRFEFEMVAKFASWKTDKSFGKGISLTVS